MGRLIISFSEFGTDTLVAQFVLTDHQLLESLNLNVCSYASVLEAKAKPLDVGRASIQYLLMTSDYV